MKISRFFSLLYIVFLLSCVACESHEQKPDDAFEIVKKQKALSLDVEEKPVSVPNKILPEKKTENLDEWTFFKREVEKCIAQNESNIKTLKKSTNINAKLFRKIAYLEKSNNELRNEMEEYSQEAKAKLEKFKFLMKSELKEMNIKVSELSSVK